MNSRLIIYGDLHGCLDELCELRENLGTTPEDIEVCVGDVVSKGPYSQELLHYLKEHNIRSVIGNHEEKLLRYCTHELKKEKNQVILTRSQKEVYEKMEARDFDQMAEFPLYIREDNITILHGGILPTMSLGKLGKRDQEKIIHLRWVDAKGHFVALDDEKNRAHFWTEKYDGREGFIVYGHQPWEEPRIDEYAAGIDTGCVYGNRLTAAVFMKLNGQFAPETLVTYSVEARSSLIKELERPNGIDHFQSPSLLC